MIVTPTKRFVRAGSSMIAVLVGIACGGGWSAPNLSSSSQADSRQVLASIDAGALAYELSIPACTSSKMGTFRGKPRCPVEVRLLQKRKVVAATRLPIASCGAAKRSAYNPLLGADPEATTWVTGFDRCRMSVAARAVALAPGITGLLITQRAGAEHPSRAHYLMLGSLQGAALETLWSADEAGAPSTMTTRVLPLDGPNQNDVAFVETYTRPLEAAQSLDATRLHFDPATRAIVKNRLPDARTSLYVLKHGSFQSADAAYEARGAEDCLGPLGVFPAALLPGLELPAFFLGLVLVRREDAALPFSDATCAAIKAETLEYRPKR